jgi:hypothetical protein
MAQSSTAVFRGTPPSRRRTRQDGVKGYTACAGAGLGIDSSIIYPFPYEATSLRTAF